MARLHRQPGCVVTALLVPVLSLASPPWLGLDGVSPAWAVLWLLPWALVDGPVSGAVAGISMNRTSESFRRAAGPPTDMSGLAH